MTNFYNETKNKYSLFSEFYELRILKKTHMVPLETDEYLKNKKTYIENENLINNFSNNKNMNVNYKFIFSDYDENIILEITNNLLKYDLEKWSDYKEIGRGAEGKIFKNLKYDLVVKAENKFTYLKPNIVKHLRILNI